MSSAAERSFAESERRANRQALAEVVQSDTDGDEEGQHPARSSTETRRFRSHWPKASIARNAPAAAARQRSGPDRVRAPRGGLEGFPGRVDQQEDEQPDGERENEIESSSDRGDRQREPEQPDRHGQRRRRSSR